MWGLIRERLSIDFNSGCSSYFSGSGFSSNFSYYSIERTILVVGCSFRHLPGHVGHQRWLKLGFGFDCYCYYTMSSPSSVVGCFVVHSLKRASHLRFLKFDVEDGSLNRYPELNFSCCFMCCTGSNCCCCSSFGSSSHFDSGSRIGFQSVDCFPGPSCCSVGEL